MRLLHIVCHYTAITVAKGKPESEKVGERKKGDERHDKGHQAGLQPWLQ